MSTTSKVVVIFLFFKMRVVIERRNINRLMSLLPSEERDELILNSSLNNGQYVVYFFNGQYVLVVLSLQCWSQTQYINVCAH